MDDGESGRRARRQAIRCKAQAQQEKANGRRKKKGRSSGFFLGGSFPSWPVGQGIAGGSAPNGSSPPTPPPPEVVNPGAPAGGAEPRGGRTPFGARGR